MRDFTESLGAVFQRKAHSPCATFEELSVLFGISFYQLRGDFKSSTIPKPRVTVKGKRNGSNNYYSIAEAKAWRKEFLRLKELSKQSKK